MLVATAGHVDHGKTSLVQRLTGTNTDRLEEERQRGLTIELGYAFSEAGGDEPIGFIDVPGHHRFINTMISGISGIDLGMLVVAADDGPMPQTLEHLQLLRILGVKRFAGVITKCDLVDGDRRKRVVEQTSALISGSPLCEVSNRSGEGLDQLKSLLQDQLHALPQRSTEAQFRLCIDRVFTKKGSGLVVTGTCLSGSVNTGDELKLHLYAENNNQEIMVRVREIHTQGKPATAGHAGQRCALNIAGKVSVERVNRGDFLCAHPTALPSRRLDTRCWTVEGPRHSLKHLGRVKLYIGTRRIGAKTYFLDRNEGKDSAQRIQLILDKNLLAFAGDRFVLRDDSESTTLGGGVVIDPDAPQWGKSRRSRLKQLDALELGRPEAALEQMLFSNGDIVSLPQCSRIWNLSPAELDDLLSLPQFDDHNLVRIHVDGDDTLVAKKQWQDYVNCMDQRLAQWHSGRPMEPGIRPELLQKLVYPHIPTNLSRAVLEDRIRAKQIVHQDQLVRALGHKPTLSHQVQRQWQQLETQMQARGLNIPLRSELQRDTGFDARQLEMLTRPAIKKGDLFEIGEKRLALPATIRELARLTNQFTDTSGGISVIEAKQVFGLGRNLTIEILEFFDKIGYTKRSDNLRIISDPNAIELR
ncbi:selenocysteine-specific translation elongation factor [Seongchinamella sediminis]|uniref:Selenocysteine-specific translation elongation factor n=1 Tax=Seongchinamella sediminis TaxID=2283635 RepID=A0A3L7DSS9_9GAMM|nr:selenocysteine-specific translation elongation factor [Seongchinamella sediminis]RLQ20717.1 selenocysteine-specific translation elongation factor [Seongchinamella sediminis]